MNKYLFGNMRTRWCFVSVIDHHHTRWGGCSHCFSMKRLILGAVLETTILTSGPRSRRTGSFVFMTINNSHVLSFILSCAWNTYVRMKIHLYLLSCLETGKRDWNTAHITTLYSRGKIQTWQKQKQISLKSGTWVVIYPPCWKQRPVTGYAA